MTQSDTPERPDGATPSAPQTAEEQRKQLAGANRNIALLLVGTAFIFLAGAVGVAVLVSYGQF